MPSRALLRAVLVLGVTLGVVGVLPGATAATCVCPTPGTQPNFDADRYLGLWFEMRTAGGSYELGGQCGTAHYAWNDNKTAVDVINANYIPNSQAGFAVNYTVNLLATPVELSAGKFTVTIPSPTAQTPATYWVLETDYDTYSVVFSCREATSSALPSISVWVLTRKPEQFTVDVQTKVQTVLMKNDLTGVILHDVAHDCPKPACKPCASTKNSLDLDRLKGRWWGIQHSPYATNADKQTCSFAEFTATTDGMEIVAKTIMNGNETNMTLAGTWVDANSKSGQFQVTSGFNGDKNDRFCIIDTDYDNWGVLSVCGATKGTLPPAPAGGTFALMPSGGLFVLARDRGLNANHQMAANKAVVSAGLAASAMVGTPSSPCPSAAFDKSAAGVGSVVGTTSLGLVLAMALVILAAMKPL